jgi:hypothetical protein
MLVIENGLLLTPVEVVLQAHLNEQAMQHMKRCNATTLDAFTIERVQTFRRVADRYLAMSGQHPRTSEPIQTESPLSTDLPQEITVRQAKTLLGWSERHIRRKIQAGEIGTLRRNPIMLSRDTVIAFKIRLDSNRSDA